MTLPPADHKPRKTKFRFPCFGCGPMHTDGRHLDRELLKDARTDDAAIGRRTDAEEER